MTTRTNNTSAPGDTAPREAEDATRTELIKDVLAELNEALQSGAFFNPEMFGHMLKQGDNPILRWRDTLDLALAFPSPASPVQAEPPEALKARLADLIARHNMGYSERFEADAERFYRDTGYMAPGKSEPLEMSGGYNQEEREKAWQAWTAEQSAGYKQLLRDLLAHVQTLEAEHAALREALGVSLGRWLDQNATRPIEWTAEEQFNQNGDYVSVYDLKRELVAALARTEARG